MKVFVLIFLLVSSGSEAACLSDSLKTYNVSDSKSMRQLEESVEKFESEILRFLPPNVELTIALEPLNPRVNAEIIKQDSQLAISIWGGMMGHPEMNPEVMSLLLCHEIGHFLGGPPLKSRNGWSSTEGQADFYSASVCIKSLDLDEETFLNSALRLTKIYADVQRQLPPALDRCDETRVTRINYGYPSVQCRLDTLISGWRGEKRPQCWYYEGD